MFCSFFFLFFCGFVLFLFFSTCDVKNNTFPSLNFSDLEYQELVISTSEKLSLVQVNTLSSSQKNSAVIGNNGGKIEVNDTDASVKIPQGAIPEGESVEITVTVLWDRRYYPPLEENDFVIGPAIHCESDGILFKKPVTVTIPHSAVNVNARNLLIWTRQSSGKSSILFVLISSQ